MAFFDDLKLGLEQAIEYEKTKKGDTEYVMSIDDEKPNKETLEALEEGRRLAKDKSAPRYKTAEELKAALGIKDWFLSKLQ